MASIKVKKMTAPQVRKELRNLSKERLTDLIEGMYKSCPDAANYLNIRFGGENFEKALLAGAREKVHDGFFTQKGKARLDLQAAKAAIDDFEKASPSLMSLFDLKLHYIEDGMEIIEHYRGVPDKLYNSVERMFRSVAKDMNAVEDPETGRAIAAEFEMRLAQIGKDIGLGDAGFHESMNACYKGIRWRHIPVESQTETAVKDKPEDLPVSADTTAVLSAPGLPELAPITDSADVLSEEDVKLFYELFFALLEYANKKRNINDLRNIARKESLDPNAVKEIAEAIWSDTSLIDSYLTEDGKNLPPEHQSVLKGWKRCVTGRFILERNLKNGAILISLEDNRVYQVRGIKSSLADMFFYRPLPVMIDAALLPFRGIIITDGLIGTLNFFMGGGMKKEFREIYTRAKRRNQIARTL